MVALTFPAVVGPGAVSVPSAEIEPASPSRAHSASSLRMKRPLSSKSQASKVTGSPVVPITSAGTTRRAAGVASAAAGPGRVSGGLGVGSKGASLFPTQ